jgi:hypothetical protein
MSKQSVTITKPDANTIQVIAGSRGFTFSFDRLKALWNGAIDEDVILAFQFHVALQQAGINPHTATAAQIKSAIEAQTYWLGQ